MEHDLEKKTTVAGHRNPDMNSTCSAIYYANLENKLTGEEYVPAKAGHVNGGTQFVLNYFGVEEPKLVEGTGTQAKDIEIRRTRGVADNISLKKVWKVMQENNVVTIPPVRPDGTSEGLITMGDIIKTYMNIYNSSILSKANTRYSNTVEALEAGLLVGDVDVYPDKGKILIAAANPDPMEFYIKPHGLVILGSKYEPQLCATEMGAAAIIVHEDADVSTTIKEAAQGRGCTVVATTYDTYTAARLISQSTSIGYFMTREHLITFNSDDHTDEIREVITSKRYRNFPILDKEGRYLGVTSRRDLLGAKGKQVILVDYDEKSQAVARIENTEIQEAIDHHRLDTVQTTVPVFFHNQPLGCMATTIYQMHQKAGVDIEKEIIELLCSATASDILLFRSPTCAPVDKMAVKSLAAIAGLDIEKYAMEVSGTGSSLKDKSNEKIFYQDLRRFTAGKVMIGVGQITPLDGGEPEGLKHRMSEFAGKAREGSGLDMVFFMLTNVLTKSAGLTCQGQSVVQLTARAFHLDLEKAT